MTYLEPNQMIKNGHIDYANGASFSFRANNALSQLISSIAEKFKVWQQRSQERQELARASNLDLADMGISVPHARFEASKPFWKN